MVRGKSSRNQYTLHAAHITSQWDLPSGQWKRFLANMESWERSLSGSLDKTLQGFFALSLKSNWRLTVAWLLWCGIQSRPLSSGFRAKSVPHIPTPPSFPSTRQLKCLSPLFWLPWFHILRTLDERFLVSSLSNGTLECTRNANSQFIECDKKCGLG